MSSLTNMTYILLGLLSLTGADTHGQGFLRKRPQEYADSLNAEYGVVSEMLGQGHGVTEDRLAHIKSTMLPIFRSLPKSNRGHISEPVMKYAMRRYFSATHTWVVGGFEERVDAVNTSDSEQDILKSKIAGFVRAALEQRFQHQGFTLDDIVSMIAVVESLVLNEVVPAVELSFRVNSLDTRAILSLQQMNAVMDSYLMIEMLQGTSDMEEHKAEKKNISVVYPNWWNVLAFRNDVTGSDGFSRYGISNPFIVKTYTFEDVVRMAMRIYEDFGPWSSYECLDIKRVLTKRDVHETGRVKLSDFYKATNDGAWRFLEPSEYLRQSGALDESSSYLGPQVIIPNYIHGKTNCITATEFFSICCLNECDSIIGHIESKIPSSNGTVSQILNSLETLPSFPVISEQMIKKLEDISALGGGSIPLHGRLFAQWLHFTFPRECPYPHEAGSIVSIPLLDESIVTEEEIKGHVQSAHASHDPSPDAGSGMWDFQEELMESSMPSDSQDAKQRSFLRLCCQLMLIGSFCITLVREALRTLSAIKGKPKEYEV